MQEHDQTSRIESLKQQIRQLYDAIYKANNWFWPALIDPSETDLVARPNYASAGSIEEMRLQLQYWYNAWVEPPGAIEVIEELSKYRPFQLQLFPTIGDIQSGSTLRRRE